MPCPLFAIAAALLAGLAIAIFACIGCSSNNPPEPEQPQAIRRKGQESGYENTTTVPRPPAPPQRSASHAILPRRGPLHHAHVGAANRQA